jgi:peptidoglycan-associated lipoprotein
MLEDASIFSAYTVYFDFDQSVIRPGEGSKISAVSDHLKANRTHKVNIEGHCDERGTEGYNMGLGERRAQAIREYLIRAGIDGNRVYSISYGESRPAVDAHTEAAWAKNRRGEFVLLTPP